MTRRFPLFFRFNRNPLKFWAYSAEKKLEVRNFHSTFYGQGEITMKWKTLNLCFGSLAFLFLASGAWAVPAYRIQYKNCTVTTNPLRPLIVNSATGASSIKIQYLKNAPASIQFDADGNSTNAPAGTLYMTAPLTIPGIEVTGPLGTLYTEAKVDYLLAPSGVTRIIGKKTWIGLILSETAIQSIKMDTIVDSFAVGYAGTTIQIAPPTPSTTPLSLSLSGIVLERLYANSPVSTLSVASKKGRIGSANVVSMSGIGRITPTALATPSNTYDCVAESFKRIQATAANIEPDRLRCAYHLAKVQATMVVLNHAKTGGIIGRSELAVVAGYSPVTIYASTMGSLYGYIGVEGTLLAGISTGPSAPSYHEGTIQKIATHPRNGHLIGSAHVAPGTSGSIKFVPQDHPSFLLCEDAGSHPPL